MAHPHQEPVREPCPHCGESAALSARICPHCKNGLLVQVELLRPLTDGRLLHQLGRSLYRAGLGSIPVPRLKASQPIVVRDVTREQAAKTLEALNDLGLPGATKPTSKGFAIPWDRLSKAPAVLAAAGALVLALALAVLFLGGSNDEDEDVASTPALALESGTVSPDTGADEGDTPATPTPSPLTTQQIAALASPSTVSLTCGRQVGSGSFVEEDLVISNAHVLCPDDDRVTVHFSDGRQANGWVRERHRDLDLVTVRVLGAAAAPLPIGDASQLRPGDKIVVIGTPHGMDVTVHEGVVSHMGRPMFGAAYIQIEAIAHQVGLHGSGVLGVDQQRGLVEDRIPVVGHPLNANRRAIVVARRADELDGPPPLFTGQGGEVLGEDDRGGHAACVVVRALEPAVAVGDDDDLLIGRARQLSPHVGGS